MTTPHVSADFRYGTAGWSYRDWEGTVYPLKRETHFNPLLFLARDFNFVEVNTTFYRIPTLKLTGGWVKKTASIPGFSFWIKVFQDFTHKRELNSHQLQHFFSSCQPLADAQKLAGFLAQFPYSFKLNTENMDYLNELRSGFNGRILAIEFRHDSWHRQEIMDFFKKNHLIWVNIDQPVISRSLALTGEMTHPELSYFRLHGRNYQSWFSNMGRDARYDYNYNGGELNGIAEKIKTLAKLAKTIFITGNNHYKGQAVRNLKELKTILEKEKSDSPKM